MTATLLVVSAITPISCVINITAKFLSLVSFLISSNICDCIDTSSAVVGSSAINNSGSQHRESDITTLCLIPPEN